MHRFGKDELGANDLAKVASRFGAHGREGVSLSVLPAVGRCSPNACLALGALKQSLGRLKENPFIDRSRESVQTTERIAHDWVQDWACEKPPPR